MEDQYYDIERRTAIKEEARMFRRKFITYEQAEDPFMSDTKDMLMQIKDKRAQEILLAQIKALAVLE